MQQGKPSFCNNFNYKKYLRATPPFMMALIHKDILKVEKDGREKGGGV
jgi:hypothetical protein